MFAQADEMNAQFVGKNRLIDHVTQDLIHRLFNPISTDTDIAKTVQPKFHHVRPYIFSTHFMRGQGAAEGPVVHRVCATGNAISVAHETT